jgi:hypothetical protein
MGRPRTPTNVLALRGAFKHDPARGRERAAEPQDARPIGPPPADFLEAEINAWNYLIECAPAGVLKFADRILLELAAKGLVAVRERLMTVVIKDLGPIEVEKPFDAKAHAAVFKYLTEMGLSPVSRSKVKVDAPPGAPSGFDRL